MRTDLENIPVRNWNKTLLAAWNYRGETLTLFATEPQAHLVGLTQPVGLLAGFSPEAILVKAFEKNYKTPAKPKVVSNYGFEQKHGEPIEQISFNFECIFDRACEAEMNRYRHNSKNYESGRYVDYIKHGLTIVIPDDLKGMTHGDEQFDKFIKKVQIDLQLYADVMMDAEIPKNKRKQQARRRLGFYVAVESTYTANLRSLIHMGTQRSAKYSPNGKEAEPQISEVVTQMLEEVFPHVPVFKDIIVEQLEKGYR